MSKTARLQELDVLRGLAALAVVFFHYTTRYNEVFTHPTPLDIDFHLGHYGVQLFFMISGFVIFMTLNRTKTTLDFVVSRFSRLYPTYWVAIILTSIFVGIFGLQGQEVSTGVTLFNFTMLQGFFNIPSVDGVYWTLTIELIFYILMLGLFKLRQLSRIETIAVIWLLISIAAALTETYAGYFPWKIRFFLLLDYAHLFMAGITFFLIKESGLSIHRVVIFALALLCEYILNSLLSAIIVACFFGVFALFIAGYLSKLSVRPLIHLGAISYSLYLIHQNIGFVIINKAYEYGYSATFAILLAMIVSLSLAHVVTVYFERPALNFIRSRYKKPRSDQTINA